MSNVMDDSQPYGTDLWVYPLRRGDTLATNEWVEWHLHRFLSSRFLAETIYHDRRDCGLTAIILWSESYRQDPAGTLPDNDVELAQLARYGRDVDAWRAVREHVLHGWRPCLVETDVGVIRDRLGHEVIAEIAAKSARRRDGRKAGRESARLSTLRSRVKGKLADMHQKRMSEDREAVSQIAAWLDESGLYANEENIRAALAAVLKVGRVVPLK